MKRIVVALGAVVALSACCNRGGEAIVIDEQNHLNEAYNLSFELASAVMEAENYEEFKVAADNIKAHKEAFRQQIGGESYQIFLEESNMILSE
ncbi:MAG: membrane lipoprotein lipid attachment site-containing protein [Alistipes sp.]|nr:membrane lipoprotein lipid attachment site-containing protein [Alistipes sp.]